jgi:hypothetical protein
MLVVKRKVLVISATKIKQSTAMAVLNMLIMLSVADQTLAIGDTM